VKILFDQGTPVPLRRSLPDHDVVTAFERGWQALKNGEPTDWRLIRQHLDHVAQAVAALKPGAYVELFFPPL